MGAAMSSVDLYQQLADAYHSQGRFQERDRFLVLAMDSACESGQVPLSEQIRQRLLELNPNHLLKPYGSSKDAVLSPNFANYLGQLRKNFPPAKAQALLNEVGQPAPRPRATMMAGEPQFPSADPVSDQQRPTAWSQVDVPRKPAPPPPPPAPVFTYALEKPVSPPPLEPVADPLAHIPPPQPRQVVADSAFRLAPSPTTSQPSDVVRPTRNRPREEIYSAASATIGNALFVVLLVASLATFCYVFVWPLV